MSCNNARFNEEGRYNCRVSGDECIYLIPNKNQCYKDGYIKDDKVDIDKIINKIIRLLKNDYLLNIDDEEEYAIKSDIYNILKEVIK